MTAAVRVVADFVPVVLKEQAYFCQQRLRTSKVIDEYPQPFTSIV
jgi:hypothetical protein